MNGLMCALKAHITLTEPINNYNELYSCVVTQIQDISAFILQ